MRGSKLASCMERAADGRAHDEVADVRNRVHPDIETLHHALAQLGCIDFSASCCAGFVHKAAQRAARDVVVVADARAYATLSKMIPLHIDGFATGLTFGILSFADR